MHGSGGTPRRPSRFRDEITERERERRKEERPPEKWKPLETDTNTPQKPPENEIKEIDKQMKKDAVQNPLTIFAFLTCGLSLIYLIFIAPFVGGGPIAFFSAVCSGAIGLCASGWKWLTKKGAIEKKVWELSVAEEKKHKELLREKLIQKRAELRGLFAEINFSDGLKELNELTAEYLKLVAYLERRKESRLISNSQIIDAMTETYAQGLNVLGYAFEITRAVQDTDMSSLEQDISDLEKQLASLRKQPPRERTLELIKIKEETLESHKNRVEKAREQELLVAKLLAQSDKCEAAMHQTMLDLNVLDIEDSDEKAREIIERIRGAIENAIAVQKALKGFNV